MTEAQQASYAEGNQIVDDCLEMLDSIDKIGWNEQQQDAYREAYSKLFSLGAVLEEAQSE